MLFENNTAILDLSDSLLEAKLTIKPVNDLINEDEIISLIKESKIKSEYIALENEEKNFSQPFTIAKVNYENYDDVQIDYLFETEVAKDTLIARMHFKRLINLLGEESQYLKNKVLEKYLGKNVYFKDGKIMSSNPGSPYLDDNGKICVQADFEISGNFTKDNYQKHFIGNAIIKGDVVDVEFFVKGSLIVHGKVINSTIKAEGFIEVKGKLENSKIESELYVSLSESLSSVVLAQKNIKFTSKIEDSFLISQDSINGEDETAAVISSELIAFNNIIVNKVKTMVKKRMTYLILSINPKIKYYLNQFSQNNDKIETEKYMELENKLIEEKNKFDFSEMKYKKIVVKGKFDEGLCLYFYGMYVHNIEKKSLAKEFFVDNNQVNEISLSEYEEENENLSEEAIVQNENNNQNENQEEIENQNINESEIPTQNENENQTQISNENENKI